MSACCSPTGTADSASATAPRELTFVPPARDPQMVVRGMLRIAGGTFAMGGDKLDAFPDDGEGPVREVQLRPFAIDATCVTNAQFAAFIKATGYVTEAEQFRWSYVFNLLLAPEARKHIIQGTVRDDLVVGDEARRYKYRGAGYERVIGQLDSSQTIAVDDQACHSPIYHLNLACS